MTKWPALSISDKGKANGVTIPIAHIVLITDLEEGGCAIHLQGGHVVQVASRTRENIVSIIEKTLSGRDEFLG